MNILRRIFNATLTNRYVPRWAVFMADITIVTLALVLAYLLRFNFMLSPSSYNEMLHQVFISLIAYSASFILFKPYTGVVRFTVVQDIFTIFYSVLAGAVACYVLGLLASAYLFDNLRIIPHSVLIIHAVLTVYLMSMVRMIVKFVFNLVQRQAQHAVNVAIYGAGELGQATLMALQKSTNPVYNPIGFIDTNAQLRGLKKMGVSIYSPEESFHGLLKTRLVREVIIAISPERIDQISTEKLIDHCIINSIAIKKVPPVHNWINGTFSPRQAKHVEISDLLGREEIALDCNRIYKGLNQKTILITGAAGSIGSEIVRQLLAFRPGKVVMVDQAESALYDLNMELVRRYNGSRQYEMVLADVANQNRMDQIFRKYRPQIVFNAAAYKHVPIIEDNVCEAIRVNIGGTRLLADLSVKYGVEKFVMISTDKAVNPTNVMGASKRICELYVQSLTSINGHSTSFITTRFGNVLGSNGSVVPLFTKQIEAGGPVTVTHRDIQRFFMTIPEACQLVLEAGFMGRGGEIFVFDMGKPVKIYDLAVRMITLAGFEPGKDIQIIETGLRPGEKLYEEVLASKETTQPTHNPKILIANHSKSDPFFVKRIVDDLVRNHSREKDTELVKKIKMLVPEFIPQNPKYIDAINNMVPLLEELRNTASKIPVAQAAEERKMTALNHI